MGFGSGISVSLIQPGVVGMQIKRLHLSCFNFLSSVLLPRSAFLSNEVGHFDSSSRSSYPIMIPASVGIRPQLHPFLSPLVTPSFHPANHALAIFKWQWC